LAGSFLHSAYTLGLSCARRGRGSVVRDRCSTFNFYPNHNSRLGRSSARSDRCSTVTLYADHNSQRRRNQTATDENHRSQVAAPKPALVRLASKLYERKREALPHCCAGVLLILGVGY